NSPWGSGRLRAQRLAPMTYCDRDNRGPSDTRCHRDSDATQTRTRSRGDGLNALGALTIGRAATDAARRCLTESQLTYHQAVEHFKKQFLAEALIANGGNRTHTARALGLQRTYLL